MSGSNAPLCVCVCVCVVLCCVVLCSCTSCDNGPCTCFTRLLDVLEVIAPFKQFSKLREFMQNKLPAGFPVKIGALSETVSPSQ